MKWIAVLVVAGLAGCLADDGKEAPERQGVSADGVDWYAIGASQYDPDHEHTLRELHTDTAIGVDVLAADTLTGDGTSGGYYIEADVQGDLIAVGVVTGAGGSDMDIYLIDRSALPEISVVGSFSQPGAYGDVKLDKERPYAYVPYGTTSTDGAAAGSAFGIWDISDPANAVRIGSGPGAGCHMLNTLVIDGTSYVWCVSFTGSIAYRIVEAGGLAVGVPVHPGSPQQDPEVLRYVDYYSSLTPLGPALLLASHDMTAQYDPLTGDPILVSAHELQGIRVFDISTPEAAVEISYWRGDGMDQDMQRVHTAGITEIDGRRIGFGATETLFDVPASIYAVDFTEWANPVFLGEWTPPGVPDDGGGVYSMHNFQIVGSSVYVANFHVGAWAIDYSTPESPEVRGLRTPVRDTGYPYPDNVAVNHNWIWDVLVVDGYSIITDAPAGIEVLHWHSDPAGDPDWTGYL